MLLAGKLPAYSYQSLRAMLVIGVMVLVARPASAVTMVIDYSYDTAGFFNPATQNGAAARATLNSVASFYSSILTDTLSSIQTPPDFHSSNFDGTGTWDWTATFPDPATGLNVSLDNQAIAADEYRIYAGARDLPGSTLGIGGPGGMGWSFTPTGGFTQAEINQMQSTTDNFKAQVEHRGEPSGFAAWGGAITFDNVGVNWNYNYQVAPVAGQNDLFSVAVHELCHSLGFGTAAEWNSFVVGSSFTGPVATAAFGSNPPVNGGHWASGTSSVVLGTSTPQQCSMTPSITVGTRKQLTALDAAALSDIGWSVSTPTFDIADFNHDHSVNAADLATWKAAFGVNAAANADGDSDSDGNDFLIWQRRLGIAAAIPAATTVPEPSAVVLAAVSLGCLCRRRPNKCEAFLAVARR
jgi:hypothetical protein